MGGREKEKKRDREREGENEKETDGGQGHLLKENIANMHKGYS